MLARTAAILLAVLGALPLARWIPGGLTDSGFVPRWTEWMYGIVLCAGAGVVWSIAAGMLSPGVRAPGERIMAQFNRLVSARPASADIAVATACFLLYATIARTVFSARPLLIDELVQVIQARMYAAGHLSIPVDRYREFFSILHVVDIHDQVYSQFPPGWPAMLAIGVATNTVWLVGPACGGIAVFLFARLLRLVMPNASGVVLVAGTALFGFAPFAAFQFSSHMSHGPVLMWLLLATLALHHAITSEEGPSRGTVRWALVMGFAAGCAFAVRPLDAVAFAVPAGAWLSWRAATIRGARATLGWTVAGFAAPLAAVLWVNAKTTGNAFQFGYEALWGASHGLGFHAAPWGEAHTMQRGVELLSAYVTRLNVYLFEVPFPSLLPVITALLVVRQLGRIERYLFVATGVHALLYFAYWHDGFFLGPRFVFPWLPLLVLLCARLFRRETWSSWRPRLRTGIAGAAAAGLIATAFISLPVRTTQYRAGLSSMRTDYAAEARQAGVTNSLVFVRESWGAQLVARLWALGVSRAATAALYSRVDACVLDHAIDRLERDSLSGMRAETLLSSLLRDSLRVRASTVSPDTTERMLPGARYDEQCSARVAADREGYALYPPLVLENETGNVYVRDFQERDTLIMNRFRDRAVWLLRRDGVDGSSPLRWIPMARNDQTVRSAGR